MLALQLPPEIEERLEAVAGSTGKTKEECAARAILDFLESEEDFLLATERLGKKRPGIPLEEVERQLGLAD